jgi:hypothetical protein
MMSLAKVVGLISLTMCLAVLLISRVRTQSSVVFIRQFHDDDDAVLDVGLVFA